MDYLIKLCSDAHDTNVAYTASWLTYWLLPLLNDPNFNTNKTLILLTFDECVSSHCTTLVEFKVILFLKKRDLYDRQQRI
jgi:hypothetical protein